jgi:hypothetical protein
MLKKVIIIDPYDHKVLSFDIDTLEEAREVLKKYLPFCREHGEIHMGNVYIVEWGELPQGKDVVRRLADIDALR